MSVFSKDLIKNEKDINEVKWLKEIEEAIEGISKKVDYWPTTYIVAGAPVIEDFNKILVLEADRIANDNFITNP